MIRPATIDDLPELLRMGRLFADKIGMEETVGYDPVTVEGLLRSLIENPLGILLTSEGGMVGGLVHPSLFNAAHLTGSELFWWTDPDKRGKGIHLLIALENEARALGAQSWMVSTMQALNFDGASKLYERRGYRASDRNFIKVFEA